VINCRFFFVVFGLRVDDATISSFSKE